jgi:hypothetical protein
MYQNSASAPPNQRPRSTSPFSSAQPRAALRFAYSSSSCSSQTSWCTPLSHGSTSSASRQYQGGVPPLRGLRLPARLEALLPVAADGFEHPVPCGPALDRAHNHHRLVYEPREQIKNVALLYTVVRPDFLSRLQRPAAGEHREAAEQHPLRLAE